MVHLLDRVRCPRCNRRSAGSQSLRQEVVLDPGIRLEQAFLAA